MGEVTDKASAYADDETTCVSSCQDIIQVSAEIQRYERVTWIRIWKRKALQGTFDWTDGPISILGVWFNLDLQFEKKMSRGTI